ncbi:MFS transporter [Allosphingosinicella deserti]|uniref:MFS transporter n=1 Tax=Allosphingosinicella deserti TaxID=2116704 RepID=A0A2P7QK27_9SPHN|nr:MFS transporter [Sphingomonas deserti]PSJ38301.1 MFS transporter [Sphingomonas deserti]
MDMNTRFRLSLMMFLQYFVWGAWFVPFATYLTRNGLQDSVGTIYSAQGWAAIAAPLFVGAIADRYFSAQKVMGVLHLFAGGLLFLLSAIGASAGTMFMATLGVLLAYMPTIALSNSVALNKLTDSEKQFPAIRVFGTIGWIVAGLIVGLVLPGEAERTAQPLYLAGAVSLIYGLYAFTLPNTPPQAGQGQTSVVALLGLDVIRTSDRSFWVLILCSTLMMIPFSFYNVYANPFLDDIGVKNAAAVQTIGQVSEVGFLLLLPLFFRWVGIKGVLFIGMAAWAVRYVLFANGFTAEGPIEPIIYLGLALHGVGFDFVFVAATIWIGNHFAADARSRAQSFLALMTWGVGYLIGSNVANAVQVGTGTGADWQSFWYLPAAFAAVTALIFLVVFRDRGEKAAAAAAA